MNSIFVLVRTPFSRLRSTVRRASVPSLVLVGCSLLGGCAMEAQAQEEMEREVACDVVIRTGEPGPGHIVIESWNADLGGPDVVRVSAVLSEFEANQDWLNSHTEPPEAKLTSEAVRINGRTLLPCGHRYTVHDADGEPETDELGYYQRVVVRTFSSL